MMSSRPAGRVALQRHFYELSLTYYTHNCPHLTAAPSASSRPWSPVLPAWLLQGSPPTFFPRAPGACARMRAGM
jgi:hypothetical protein